MSVNRRTLLSRVSSAATASVIALGAGCTAAGFGDSEDDVVHTYTLTMTQSNSAGDDEANVLDYYSEGLTFGQRELVDEAVRSGSYAEEDVSWGTAPGREPITMEFQMVLQLIARHVGRDVGLTSETSFETASRYDGRRYRTIVEVE